MENPVLGVPLEVTTDESEREIVETLLVEELLVEEISIDGMCGVY